MLKLIFFIVTLMICSCIGSSNSRQKNSRVEMNEIDQNGSDMYSKREKQLVDMGMVNIADYDSTIAVHIVYATPDNFMKRVLYTDIDEAFMLPEVAEKLVAVQQKLKNADSSLSLIVYDAARPISIQKEMWQTVEGTDKEDFVSNPQNGGGLHNYGAAVDVSIIDTNGDMLPMGTAYDYFGDAARINNEAGLVASKLITEQELANRLLLRKIMVESGFKTIESEWWHFNHVSRSEAIEKLKLIE